MNRGFPHSEFTGGECRPAIFNVGSFPGPLPVHQPLRIDTFDFVRKFLDGGSELHLAGVRKMLEARLSRRFLSWTM